MAFHLLAPETNNHIASYLDDRDLCAFISTCRQTYDHLNDESASIWRSQFSKYFDTPPNTRNEDLKEIYQFWKKALRNGAQFRDGKSRREKQCLEVLKSLVVRSFVNANPKSVGEGSRNLTALVKFVRDHDILRNVMAPKYASRTDPLLLTLQVVMSHLQFDLEVRSPTFGFPDSQKTVYATVFKQPLFKGPKKTEVNMDFVANAVNFFKYHMTRPEEQTLYNDYQSLHQTDRPRAWNEKLQNGARKLGKSWKGIYSYLELDDLAMLRRSNGDDELIMDNFSEEHATGVFQTLELDFPANPFPWPNLFERILKSRTHPSASHLSRSSQDQSTKGDQSAPRTRAQHRNSPPSASTSSKQQETIDPKPLNFQFVGSGLDAEPFLATGWLNPLPSQQDIPGWMRWTMMKFFQLEVTDGVDSAPAAVGVNDDPFAMKGSAASVAAAAVEAAVDGSALWAYEGVVLPGGQVVVGRWWGPRAAGADLNEESYSGPFMFWCVDEGGHALCYDE